jgi:hypothetical protein
MAIAIAMAGVGMFIGGGTYSIAIALDRIANELKRANDRAEGKK